MIKHEIACECDITHPESIEKVQKQMLSQSTLDSMTQLFSVFSHSTRTKILVALSIEELCVCDVSALMNMSKSAVSHQLAVLKKSKLVKNRRDGKNIYYSLDDDHVFKIIQLGLDHIKE